MPNVRRQISEPGAAATGEAWMRICRRLRLELGEDVFSSWFGCLELDALSGEDAYLSVPTKFLKSWIQSHYTDKILQALTSEFPHDQTRVDQCPVLDTASAPPCRWRPLSMAPCGDADSARGRNVDVIDVLAADGSIRRGAAIVEKIGIAGGVRGRHSRWVRRWTAA